MFKSFLATLLATVAIASNAAAVDANNASQADLEAVKGIGPGMSTRILDERKKSPFKDWSDFVGRVKGVGDGNAAKFSGGGLTVNGAAYAAPAADAATATKAPRHAAGTSKGTKAAHAKDTDTADAKPARAAAEKTK